MHTAMKELRIQKGITQRDMARKVGISESVYQLYEYGKREPKARTAIRIADALGVMDIRSLWGGNPTS
ncbi:MAG: helix-turn-helix transcriptional regulator [Selenomonas sp.]|nr:helix-turn-helix transcriptional regulator [Selenomonas sp.]